MRIGARKRLDIFLDEDGREEIAADVVPVDRLKFKDVKKYKDRLSTAQKNTGEKDALIAMQGCLKDIPVVAVAFEFAFHGGSMGYVVGERFTRAANVALETKSPLICFAATGGARMQEALISLMQMAKTSAVIERLKQNSVPYISVMTDPVYGGVSASLALLGDLNIAEPDARAGFAGPAIIEQTIRQKLPKGFQRSEFLLEHGAIDTIIHRREMRDKVASLIAKLTEMELGLDRIRQVAAALCLLEPDATVITVAGTNGKGSCVASLEALLLAHGHSCGAYTSPHILRYNERIKIDGREVSDGELCRAFSKIDGARGDITLTYFEFATLAALCLFAEHKVDYWLLEVGIGGRLDAINIVDSDVAIITSVDIDHVQWLGNSRESIGYEKAGICRFEKPLVCSDCNPPDSVREAAEKLHCPIYTIGNEFQVENNCGSDVPTFSIAIGSKQYSDLRLHLPETSVAAALQALDIIIDLDFELVADTVNRLGLAGRFEQREVNGKTFLLDVAHNPAAMENLARQLFKRFPDKQFTVVIAMMEDKNINESLTPLLPIVDAWHLTSIEGFSRAASTEQLRTHLIESFKTSASLMQSGGDPQNLLQLNGQKINSHSDVESALKAILSQCGEQYVLVTGSFFTVGEASMLLNQLENQGAICG